MKNKRFCLVIQYVNGERGISYYDSEEERDKCFENIANSDWTVAKIISNKHIINLQNVIRIEKCEE